MGRQYRSTLDGFSGSDLGQFIGEAIGEGIAAGTQKAFEEIGQELGAMVDTMVEALRQELTASLASQAASEEFVQVVEGLRVCEEPGCGEPALARSLCRRHYARKLYQERKERLGTGGTSRPRRVPAYAADSMGGAVNEKKLAAVAPIIRRKKTEMPAPANLPEVVQPLAAANAGPVAAFAASNGPNNPSVSVDAVARFFGLNKG